MTSQNSFHHPRYERTSRKPITINGINFSSYSTGLAAFALISDDGQIFVTRNYQKTTYRASVMIGGTATRIGHRYQTESAALKAAIKYRDSQPTEPKFNDIDIKATMEAGTKGIGETWATKLDRSIADAQKIARRHSTGSQDCNPNDQIRIHEAAMHLIRLLDKARQS